MTRLYSCLLALTLLLQVSAQVDLEAGFKNPPNDCKPRTWMHAMSGNMSKEGMTKDLEALAAAGEGGVILFNIANTIPYGTVAYNSEEHHEIITHAAKESERLGLSFGVHNCDGWSSSGGPWIKPEESMKMVVNSESVVDGGEVSLKLPQPTTREGFYRDIAVLAYPSLESEVVDAEVKPKVTASHPDFDIKTATDRLIEGEVELKKGKEKFPWLLFDYGKEFTIRSLDMYGRGHRIEMTLESSDDGKNFTEVDVVGRFHGIGKQKNVFSDQFEPITARYFRMVFNKSVWIREATLRSTRPYDDYVALSGMGDARKYYKAVKKPEPKMVVSRADVRDLTASFGKDGVLRTQLPPGKWTILRFGYTSTGAINWPASKWGVGLECDKFSRSAFKTHFDAFCQRVIDNSQKVAPNALQYIEIDSFEMGGQTWTEGFPEIFLKEKGYEVAQFLPLFAGKYLDDTETVEAVCWDLNDVFCDLMTKNYFDYFSELCHANGLISYVEPYGNGPVNGLDVAAKVDIPMGEFWTTQPTKIIDAPISGAHIYGKPVISAEAFTSRTIENWKFHPAMGKEKGDEMWARGINEFMFHRFTHQPNTHVEPGMTMARYGSHVDRTQTWWMNAGKAWFSYLSRGQFLLRQGHHVADVLVFTGDQPRNDATFKDRRKCPIPYGLNFDSTNSDVLLNRIKIKGDKLVLPEGNPYSFLMLEGIDVIELATLQRIKEITDAGITVIGKPPKRLAGYLNREGRDEFESLVEEIWSRPNCVKKFDFSKVPQDFRVEGREKTLFMHRRTSSEDIYFFSNSEKEAATYECVVRLTGKIPELWDPVTGEITRLARFIEEDGFTRVWVDLESLQCAFLIFRESSEWIVSVAAGNRGHAYYLGEDQKLFASISDGPASEVTLSNGQVVEVPQVILPEKKEVSGAWTVQFRKEDHYEATETFETLIDWKDHEKKDIQYYAGTAIYRKDFNLEEKPKANEQVILDLGQVSIAAEVKVNGENIGVLWIAPFEADIAQYLKKGSNELEIQVTNQWSNRLIGDEHYPKQDDGYKRSTYTPDVDSRMPEWYLNNEPMPKGPRVTFCTGQFYRKNSPLLSSGLLGPVTLSYRSIKELN